MILSICFLIIYLHGFTGSIQRVIGSKELSNLEWYLVYTGIGIMCIVWCYFKWELALKACPKLEDEVKTIAFKKYIVFSGVMALSFYYGYAQTAKAISGNDIDILLLIANATIISGIIALDRVLNQLFIINKE